ncbi:hypothetical protein JTB14_017897 [Gonioctena quinquepunctata]|nr:hypothetical protein JTB14_017897 [Gonioctena quinquepunctata]
MSVTLGSLHKLIERENAEMKDEINGLRNSLQEEITTVTSKITLLENENSSLKKRVLDLERREKNTILLCMVLRKPQRTQSGKAVDRKNSPIVAEVLCYDLKSQILNAANLLREDLRKLGVIFSKDYAKENYITRKFLYNQLKLAKAKARLKNDQLYLNNE